jgi:hypothetical protein
MRTNVCPNAGAFLRTDTVAHDNTHRKPYYGAYGCADSDSYG